MVLLKLTKIKYFKTSYAFISHRTVGSWTVSGAKLEMNKQCISASMMCTLFTCPAGKPALSSVHHS